MSEPLESLRSEIDRVDDRIVELLNERFALRERILTAKRERGCPIADHKREQEILTRVIARAPLAERDTVAAVFERLFGSARGLVETIARGVAIRGGKVLLCRAKGSNSTYLPGGHIEFGETAAAALAREVEEELGATAKVGRFLGVVENSFLQHGKEHSEINLVYAMELDSDSTAAQENWIEFEWCALADLGAANLLPAKMAAIVRGADAPATGIERLHQIMVRLRDPEHGCPWDRVQTLETLKPCVLEETYELLSAMDRPEDKANHIEELGDVLLQVMFQSVMAEQTGEFSFDDVANAISDKLVYRHPHVFGNVKADDPATVLKNWERLKQMEHRKESRHSALDGVPQTLPALLKARRTMEKAKRIGYEEELPKVEIKGDPGEYLLATVKSIAALGVDSEAALEKATAAYADRFRKFEQLNK